MNNEPNPMTAPVTDNPPSTAGHAKLVAKINRFSKLEAGWVEGKGIPFNQKDLDWFTSALVNHFPNSLPEPTITPTADGEVRLEWNQDNQVIILETEVRTRQTYYLSFNRKTKVDQEVYLDLNEPANWQWLINQLITILKASRQPR